MAPNPERTPICYEDGCHDGCAAVSQCPYVKDRSAELRELEASYETPRSGQDRLAAVEIVDLSELSEEQREELEEAIGRMSIF